MSSGSTAPHGQATSADKQETAPQTPEQTATALQQELHNQLRRQQAQLQSPELEENLIGPSAVSQSPLRSHTIPSRHAPMPQQVHSEAAAPTATVTSHRLPINEVQPTFTPQVESPEARPSNPVFSAANTGASNVAGVHESDTPDPSFLTGNSGFGLAGMGVPVGESVGPLAKTTSKLSGGASASTASVWWRAPWQVAQGEQVPETLVKPSKVKQSQLSGTLEIPEGSEKVLASSPASITASRVATPQSSGKAKPYASLRSPPTPVPLLFSTSQTTLSPVQQGSQSKLPKASSQGAAAAAAAAVGNPTALPVGGLSGERISERIISASTGMDSFSTTLPPATKPQKPNTYCPPPEASQLPQASAMRSQYSGDIMSTGATAGEFTAAGGESSLQLPDDSSFLVSSTRRLGGKPAKLTAAALKGKSGSVPRPTSNGAATSLICERSESGFSTDSSVVKVAQTLLPPTSAHSSDKERSERIKRSPGAHASTASRSSGGK